MSALDKKGYSAQFGESKVSVGCWERANRYRFPYKPRVWREIMEGDMHSDGLYHLNVVACAHVERVKTLAVVEQSVELWHRRFGHLGYEGLRQLAREMVEGLGVTAAQVKKSAEVKRLCKP
jgi:hypothetical protein